METELTWLTAHPAASSLPLLPQPKAGWERRTGKGKLRKTRGLRQKEFNGCKKTSQNNNNKTKQNPQLMPRQSLTTFHCQTDAMSGYEQWLLWKIGDVYFC